MTVTAAARDYETFALGDLKLQSGKVLPSAFLAYKTYGTLSPKKDNVILFPTAFGGTHVGSESSIQPGLALDPTRYFVVVTNMFGNGMSSSPSNTPAPFDGPNFPGVTIHDMVRTQHRLLTEKFGIDKLLLVTGTSMGGLQSFEWGAQYPDMVERIVPRCGAGRCSVHNFVFLEGPKAVLTCDPAFAGGRYTSPPVAGLRAMGRVWAGWALSHAFYREHRYKELGFDTLEAYLVGAWEQSPRLHQDANDVLAMIWSWQHADISANDTFKGDFNRALAAIKADAIVMPGSTDLYFPVADNAYEVAHMPHAELRPIPSIWGHLAGGRGMSRADEAVLEGALTEILARPARS